MKKENVINGNTLEPMKIGGVTIKIVSLTEHKEYHCGPCFVDDNKNCSLKKNASLVYRKNLLNGTELLLEITNSMNESFRVDHNETTLIDSRGLSIHPAGTGSCFEINGFFPRYLHDSYLEVKPHSRERWAVLFPESENDICAATISHDRAVYQIGIREFPDEVKELLAGEEYENAAQPEEPDETAVEKRPDGEGETTSPAEPDCDTMDFQPGDEDKISVPAILSAEQGDNVMDFQPGDGDGTGVSLEPSNSKTEGDQGKGSSIYPQGLSGHYSEWALFDLSRQIQHLEQVIFSRLNNTLTPQETTKINNDIANTCFRIEQAFRSMSDSKEKTGFEEQYHRIKDDYEAEIKKREIHQKNEKSADLNRRFDAVMSLSPRDFEIWCTDLFAELGFERPTATPLSNDKGIDVFCRKNGELIAVQCKKYTGIVGAPEIQKFMGAIQNAGATGGYFITTGSFSIPAEQMAYRNHVELIDRGRLKEIISIAMQKNILPTVFDVQGDLFDNLEPEK